MSYSNLDKKQRFEAEYIKKHWLYKLIELDRKLI